MARVTRNPVLPMIRIPVLYVPLAMEEFERAVNQTPEYGDEIIDGYIPALIYHNAGSLWNSLKSLQERGIVWMPAEN